MKNTNREYDTNSSQSDNLVDLKQACKKTSLSKSRIYELLKVGQFPAKIKLGRTTRFSENELNQWIADAKAQRTVI